MGKAVYLKEDGILKDIAKSINKASRLLSRQNQARANWIGGISHDIRTPLSLILGYSKRISEKKEAALAVKKEAELIFKQSIQIKELVNDLNLVSQLEYEMQPLRKSRIRLSKILRSCAAELINFGLDEKYNVEINISPESEKIVLNCDERLISRAVSNLVNNSINHNEKGCLISLTLKTLNNEISIIVEDNGKGVSQEKLKELNANNHYLESTDDSLNLSHGLGLLLVRQIVKAHEGKMQIYSHANQGFKTILTFNLDPSNTETKNQLE